MGFTYVRAGMINPEDHSRSVEVELLVDTGSLYTMAPKRALDSIGVKPLARRRFKTADGRLIERGVGEVLTSLMEERRHAPVAFGEEGDASVLGTTALEIFGLELDPVTRQLKPATMPLLKLREDPELERILAELLRLARRKPLPQKDLERAKQLMVRLREVGFTNIEVSELTDGGWSEPSVKLYTRGATVKDPNPKERYTKLLVELTDRELTLDQVEQAISTTKVLEDRGLTLEQVLSFLGETRKLGIEAGELIDLHEEVKASKMTLAQLKEALTYRSELEERGFGIETLESVNEVAKAYGKPEEVLEALETYRQLRSLQTDVAKLGFEKTRLEKAVSDLKLTIQELEKQKEEITGALRKHKELVDHGFTEEVLEELRRTSVEYGGVKAILKALISYTSLKNIEKEIGELEKKREDVERAIDKTNINYAHLQSVVKMCDSLIYKYKFSTLDVNELIEVAKSYGTPVEVLKAVGRYGELKRIEAEATELSNKRAELEARIKELEKQLQELRGIAEELRNFAKGLLKPLVDEMSRGVNSIQLKFAEAIDTISTRYGEYSKKLGELKAEAGKLEEELRLARILGAIIKYPSEAKDLPFDYALLLQEAVAKLCMAKGINPKVKAGDELHSKYYNISQYVEPELLDIIGWARRGISSTITTGVKG